MEHFSFEELRQSKKFIDNIRWDVTPKILLQPRLPVSGKKAVNIDGNMFYVDIVYNRPTLVIMRNTSSMSKTVGYVEDVPEDLLKEAMKCSGEECIAGMYPITGKLEEWLKKELGLS
ncbi:MAG: hypothetical protein L0922_03380 [Candidatus Mariimomonas ferrooxydans]